MLLHSKAFGLYFIGNKKFMNESGLIKLELLKEQLYGVTPYEQVRKSSRNHLFPG